MRQAVILTWLLCWFSVLVISTPSKQPDEQITCPKPAAPFLKLLLGPQSGLYEVYLNMWLSQHLSPQQRAHYSDACVQEIISSVLRLEPYYESIYLLSSYILNFNLEKPEEAFQVLLAGQKLFPKSWRLLMSLGYIQAFELHNKSTAAVFYKAASLLRPEIAYVGSLADKLIQDQAIDPNAQEMLRNSLLSSPESEKLKQFMELR